MPTLLPKQGLRRILTSLYLKTERQIYVYLSRTINSLLIGRRVEIEKAAKRSERGYAIPLWLASAASTHVSCASRLATQ